MITLKIILRARNGFVYGIPFVCHFYILISHSYAAIFVVTVAFTACISGRHENGEEYI